MATNTATLTPEFYLRPERPFATRLFSTIGTFVARKPLGAFGAVILLLVLFVGAFSPWLAGDPNTVHLSDTLARPSTTYWFGTDHNGRDIYSRIVFGCQITAMVGIGTVLLVTLLSLLVGVSSGYFGGRFDFLVQRLVDIWLSFPAIFLILTLVAVLKTTSSNGFFGLGRGPEIGPNPVDGEWFWYTFPRTTIVILALGLVLAGGASRVVRSATLQTRVNPYIEAAEVLGATHGRIIVRHIIPNIMPTMIVLATVQLGTAILAEATISFLGIGITNFPTWGQMLSGKTRELAADHMHLALFPGMAIFLAVFGFNMLGDALRDVLDPRLRGTR